MKKNVLWTSMLVLLSSSAWAQVAPPSIQAAAPAPVAPTSSVTNSAVNRLEQTLNAQGASSSPVVAQPNAASPPLNMGMSNGGSALSLPSDESTLLREASKYQAQLAFLEMMSKINKARLDMERERLKFEEEKLKAQQEKNGASSVPMNAPSSNSGSASPSLPVAPVTPAYNAPVVRSIYSYNGEAFAEMIVNDQKIEAKSGTVLSDGTKIVSIGNGSVVTMHKGKKTVLGVSTSSGSTMPALPAATAPSGARGSLPPLPPSGR